MLAFDDTHAALRTGRNTFADGLNIKPVVLRNVHDRFARLDFEFNVLRNEFHFHQSLQTKR
jgi:hypothetical protein